MRYLILFFTSVRWGHAAFPERFTARHQVFKTGPEQKSAHSRCQEDHPVEATCQSGSRCAFLVQTCQLVLTAALVAASIFIHQLHIHTVRKNRKETTDELRAAEAAGLICHTSFPLMLATPSFCRRKLLEGSGHTPTDRPSASGTADCCAVLHATPYHIQRQSQLHAVADACS